MKRTALLFCSLIALTAATPAFAQDKKAEEKPAVAKTENKKEEPKKKEETKKVESVLKKEQPPAQENTPIKKWVDAENALIDPLSQKDKESFFILRNKYSVIRVIRVVERDIKSAVKSCGDKNPDMKSKMNDRFKQWQNAVDPILDTAKKQLDKDIETQTIVDVKKAKNVLKLNDEAYEYGEKQVRKEPVSTKEACQGLIDSMDRTEDDMIKLLQQTLLPESVIRKRSAEMDKAKEKAKAAPAKEKTEKAPEKETEKPAAKKAD